MTLKFDLPTIPAALVDVSMIDAQSCAAAASISISSWHAAVRDGAAPRPAVRLPRMTRWLLTDVRNWLIERAAQGQNDPTVIEKAASASAKAQTPEARSKARATRMRNIQARCAPAGA